MEGVERTNTVIVRNLLQEQGRRSRGMRRDPYVMDVNRERNYYSCGGFGYLAQNCRSQEIMDQGRRMEYRDNLNDGQNNLNGEESLIVLN